ncbi:hypothetical protein VE02_00783 [Pseudogymnoascus sp. 03VT05]|nr:hypothetical protein VE02_00783 [Pseudogymnoascus sp. 03VT05]
MPDIVATFQREIKTVLLNYTRQAPVTHEGRVPTELATCMSMSNAERNTPHQELNAALLGPHYHTKWTFLCQTAVITVSRTISTADVQLEEREEANGMEKMREASHSYRYITTLEIRMDLRVWRRGLKAVIGRLMRPYTSDLDFRLSTYHIVDENAPIFQAAKSFDIHAAQTLFTSGCASPFDQNTSGHSLFDWVFYHLCFSREMSNATQGLKLLNLLVDCGGIPISLANKRQPGNFPWIELATRESIPVENQQIVTKAIRLVFKTCSQNPISNWNVGICMTLKSQRNPIGEVVMQ